LNVRSSGGSRLGLALLLAGCGGSLPPLRGHIEVGTDPFVVFVGGTSRAGGDLYAVPGSGGAAIPVTFTAVGEMRPALAPNGGAVAFLRGGSLRDSTPASVWVMNLLSGAEREIPLPRGAGRPARVGWGAGGDELVIEAGGRLYRSPAPPGETEARPVPEAGRARAESALAVLVGRPAFARVVRCAERGDLCVQADTGAPGLLARSAAAAARYGDDSVLVLIGRDLLVRPVGPGHARRIEWSGLPPAPREPTAFGGASPGTR
jgi:hypothetical protein